MLNTANREFFENSSIEVWFNDQTSLKLGIEKTKTGIDAQKTTSKRVS